MKKQIIYVIFSLFILLNFSACRYCTDNFFYYGNQVELRTANGLKTLSDNPAKNFSDYTVVVLTDIHTGGTGNHDTWPALFSYLDSKKGSSSYPKFCISLGDSADHGDIPEYIEYDIYIKRLEKEYGLKTYNVIGNHDCYQSGWDHWNKYCYPFTSFYKFETDGFSWYFLDSGTGYLGKVQMNQLKKEMASDPKPKIVSTHYPIYTQTLLFCMEDTTERNELISLFGSTDVKMVLGGHIHKTETNNFGSFQEFTLPSFRYQQKWGILTVNEQSKTVSAELVQ